MEIPDSQISDPAANPPDMLVNQNDQPILQGYVQSGQNGPLAGSLLDNRQENLMKNQGFNDDAYVFEDDNDDFSSGGVFTQNSGYKPPTKSSSLNPTVYQNKKRQAVLRQSDVKKVQMEKKSKKECAENYDPLECDLPPYEGPENCGDNCGAPGSVIASPMSDGRDNNCIGSDCDSVFPSEDLPGSHIVSITANDCNPGDITCAHPIENQVNAEVQALRLKQQDNSQGSPMAERLVRDSGRELGDQLARNIVGVCKQIHPRGEAVLSEASTETECCCANYVFGGYI